jgi:hypothetical protein
VEKYGKGGRKLYPKEVAQRRRDVEAPIKHELTKEHFEGDRIGH